MRNGLLILLVSVSLSAGYFSNRRSQDEIQKAQQLANQGKLEEAIRVYQKVIENYPDSDYLSQAWLEMGKLYYQKQDYLRSANCFEQAKKNPATKDQFREATLFLGKSYFQLKRYQNVIDLLSGLYEQYRGSESRKEVAELIYHSCRELKNYPKALLWLEKYAQRGGSQELEKIKPQIPQWLSSKKSSELLELFNQAESEWLRTEVGYLLALDYSRSNQLKEAQELAKTLLEQYPSNPHQAELKELLNQTQDLLNVVPNRLGMLFPLSGTYQDFGERALKGALLAGGIFQYPKTIHKFEFRVENSYGDPELAKSAVRKMIMEDHIIALVGPILNPVASAVAEVCEQMNLPMIALSPAPGITEKKNFIFRNCLTKQSQVQALLDWAFNEKNFTSFAVLYPENKYGIEFAEIFAQEVRARGGQLMKSVSYPPEETDFREAIGRLEPRALTEGIKKDPRPLPLSFQALFLPEGYEKIGQIVPQLLFYRVRPQLLGTSSWHTEKIFEHCRQSYLEKAVFPDLFAPEIANKEFDDYKFRYQQAYNEDPSLIDLQAYETVALIIDLVEKQKVSGRKELVNALKEIHNWPGPLGPLTIDPDGEFKHPLHLFQIEKGNFVMLK